MIVNSQYIICSILLLDNYNLSNHTRYSPKYYTEHNNTIQIKEPYKNNYTLEHNYLTTEKFLEQEIKKYQEIIR
jgi:hypothetical protein